MKQPHRIAALIIQNGDIYEDELGPKYSALQEYFRNPTVAEKSKLAAAITEDGFRDEFLNEVRPGLAELIAPDLWKLHWSLMTPRRREIALNVIAGLGGNLSWFPRYQAYLRDLPEAELHLLTEVTGFWKPGLTKWWRSRAISWGACIVNDGDRNLTVRPAGMPGKVTLEVCR